MKRFFKGVYFSYTTVSNPPIIQKSFFSSTTPRDYNWKAILLDKCAVEDFIKKYSLEGKPIADSLRAATSHYQYANVSMCGKRMILFGNTTTKPVTYLLNDEGLFVSVENQPLGINSYNNIFNHLHKGREVSMLLSEFNELNSVPVSSEFLKRSDVTKDLTESPCNVELDVLDSKGNLTTISKSDIQEPDQSNN